MNEEEEEDEVDESGNSRESEYFIYITVCIQYVHVFIGTCILVYIYACILYAFF